MLKHSLMVLVTAGCFGGADIADQEPAPAVADAAPADWEVSFRSSIVSDYASIGWNVADPDSAVPAWMHDRVAALSPEAVPDRQPARDYAYRGRGVSQQVEADINLTTGEGTVTIRSSDDRTLVRLRGLPGAFVVAPTSDHAESLSTIFSAEELADAPWMIRNDDPSLLVVEENRVGDVDHTGALEGATSTFGLFLGEEPDPQRSDEDWKEKWCWIVTTTSGDDFQEY